MQTVTSVDFSDLEHLPASQINRFRSEDLVNPRPTIFEGISGKDGEASTAGANPAAAEVHSTAPPEQHSQSRRPAGFNYRIQRPPSTEGSARSTASDASERAIELSPRSGSGAAESRLNPTYGMG